MNSVTPPSVRALIGSGSWRRRQLVRGLVLSGRPLTPCHPSPGSAPKPARRRGPSVDGVPTNDGKETSMRRLTVIVSILGALALAATAAALIGGGTASAGAPPNKCPETPPFEVPGPEICTFTRTEHRELPAGTRCDFDVTIDIEWQGRIYFFANPPRAVAHMASVGTAAGNGHTLVRTARFTETAS